MSPLIYAAALLAAATGALHIYFAFTLFAGLPSAPLFVGMGIAYFAGIAAYFANFRRPLVLKGGAVYVVLLIVAWAVVYAVAGQAQQRDPVAFVDKAVEAALLGVLLIAMRKQRPLPTA